MLPGCPGCHALLTSALPLFSPYRGARLSGLPLVSIRPVQAPVLLVSHVKVYFTKKQSAHLSLELGPADGNYTYRCGSCLGLKHNYFIPALCQLWVLDAAFTPRGSEANNSCAGSYLLVAQVKQIQLVPVIPDQQTVLRIHVAPFDQRLVIGR